MMIRYIYSINVFYYLKIIFPINTKTKGENVKITKLSLAAMTALAMTTGAMAEVDLKTTGQAVVYYQTVENGGDSDLFNQDNSRANVGLQLNVNGDLGNGFGLGLQGTALGTAGLEKNLVSNVMQQANGLNGVALTKAYLTKKVGNTLIKAGRQELPKSLSPLAFSEGWNVFKNTFDAVLAINSDIQDTTLVGAYVSSSNGHGNLSSFDNLTAVGGVARPGNGAYMLTAQNKSMKDVTVTGSYYSIISGGAEGATYTIKDNAGKDVVKPAIAPHVDALWLDVKAANLGPVNLALQAGQLSPDGASFKDTTAYGVKVGGKAGSAKLSVAYTSVDDGTLSVQNVGTGIKTPLYTQMVANQGHISSDADTVVLKGVMPLGAGTLIAQYGLTTDNKTDNSDFNELDVIYKFKALGTNMLAAYVRADHEAASDPANIIRVWTRYNF